MPNWETGNGLPDISLLEPLAKALDISVIELLSGDAIQNRNKSANMAKMTFLMAVSDMGTQFVKLYPEGAAEARFKTRRVKKLYWYCNRHGLFSCPVSRRAANTPPVRT